MGYTFYPHQDSNGNDKPGDFGAVLDEGGNFIFSSISYSEAAKRLKVERATHDIPVVVDITSNDKGGE